MEIKNFDKPFEEVLNFKVDDTFKGKRLDQFLHTVYPEYSRSYYQKIIKDGYTFINSCLVKKPSKKLKGDENITLFIPPVPELKVKPENIPLKIFFEDKDIAVIYKPPHLVVHPSPGHERGTLVNALLYHFKQLSEFGGKFRAGIVHRLDKDTAGLMVVAKTDFAHKELQKQFQNREVDKRYKAILIGIPKKEYGIIDLPIGRSVKDRKKMGVDTTKPREAITEYWLEKSWEKHNLSLVDIKLHTGRTHQIRVHFSAIGHPLLNDKTYGFKKSLLGSKLAKSLSEKLDYHALVAYRLAFRHPRTNEKIDISLDKLPEPLEDIIQALDKYRD
ncbi:MAG: RluA family pseudouridine synthase [Persephonella sp.]|nr:MAG: RluA family pseudouridine synthase [Persephonella sp.]